MNDKTPSDDIQSNKAIPTHKFEFEVVTINYNGDIIHRHSQTAEQFKEELSDGISLDMVLIPAGTYLMGSRRGTGYDDEYPQHHANIPSFLISKCPVTQEQWAVVMDWSPPYRCLGPKRPVDRVSWQDASQFCHRLSKLTGHAYRLPSESEWEYACRSNTTTPFYFGQTLTTDFANYVGEHHYASEPKGIYRHVTTDVGSFPPNTFGLFDMHGNVWEWCADTWHDSYIGAPSDGSAWISKGEVHRVMRGGCWHDPPDLCRSAARLKANSRDGEDYFGFRVALTSREQNPEPAVKLSAQSIIQRIRSWLS